MVPAGIAEAAACDRPRSGWTQTPELAVYRFAIEEVFRLQEHVLNEQGEKLLSLTERLGSVPKDSYAALSTADARFPTITLSTGETTQVSYGQYRKLLATCRSQADRRLAYEALYDTYTASLNTYAAIYNGVMHGDWFEARARGYQTTLDAALFGNAIPTSVVENLIRETKNGVAPFRRYHKLRKRVLQPRGLLRLRRVRAAGRVRRASTPTRMCSIGSWRRWRRSAPEYQARVRRAFSERWIDVYENQGKRSGAYSAPVYGANPYMLMNYNDTLDAVFTLAHELGHSMHTMLSHETQPFVYAGYTIFVAEVPSTLNEALLLNFMLDARQDEGRAHRPAAARHRRHRRHLLQPGAVRRLRARGASAGGAGSADHVRSAERDLREAARRVLGRCAVARSSARSTPGRAFRTSSSRRTTSINTRPALRRRRS